MRQTFWMPFPTAYTALTLQMLQLAAGEVKAWTTFSCTCVVLAGSRNTGNTYLCSLVLWPQLTTNSLLICCFLFCFFFFSYEELGNPDIHTSTKLYSFKEGLLNFTRISQPH